MSVVVGPDEELAGLIAELWPRLDRIAMVLWKWGEGDLEGIEEPDVWQMEYLRELGELIKERGFDGINAAELIRTSVGSGRGPGKSALVGMMTCVLLAAWPDCKVTVTANTETQLQTRTWPEIRTWMMRSLVADWFEVNSAIIYRKEFKTTCFAAPVPWSEDRPQAFAGQHNRKGPNVIIADEASGVADVIADVSISGMKTGLPIWAAFGNVTQTRGFFYESLFGMGKGRYDISWSIDSRNCRFPNKAEIAKDIEEYGEDSDYVRVWIRGLAPKASDAQFFSDDLISACQGRRPAALKDDALVVGVDFSWGGEDFNTIRFRCGLDAWSIAPIRVPGEHTRDPEVMIGRLAEVLSKEWGGHRVSMMFLDSAGIAGPVAMRLRQLGWSNVVSVNFGAHAVNMEKHKNVRAMMFDRLKEWMLAGGGIGTSKELNDDLKAMRIEHHVPMQFVSKEIMRNPKMLGHSTDDADALALTFYMQTVTPAVAREREMIDSGYERAYRPASAWS